MADRTRTLILFAELRRSMWLVTHTVMTSFHLQPMIIRIGITKTMFEYKSGNKTRIENEITVTPSHERRCQSTTTRLSLHLGAHNRMIRLNDVQSYAIKKTFTKARKIGLRFTLWRNLNSAFSILLSSQLRFLNILFSTLHHSLKFLFSIFNWSSKLFFSIFRLSRLFFSIALYSTKHNMAIDALQNI